MAAMAVGARVTCLYNFEAQEKDQLSMSRGETFEVLDDGAQFLGWRRVQASGGTRSGYVPENYIEAESGEEVFGAALPAIMAR